MASSFSQPRVLAATILGSAVVFVDGTVVNVALPALRADLHATLAEQQWVIEAYLLLLGSLVLVGGSLGDLFGRRRILAIGVGGFGAASLLCAAAPSATLLVGARAIQGVFGALLVPTSLAVLAATFGERERAAAIGAWTAWTSAMIAFGPPLGGVLIDLVSWRAVFAINVPLVLACLWLIATAMPPDGRAGATDRGCVGRPRVDVVGGALCALALGGPVYALIRQPELGWSSPEVVAGLAGGAAMLVAFVAWEAHHPEPMLPLGVFRARNFAVGNVATLLLYGGLGASTFLLAVFLQEVARYSAVQAGLALLPISLLMIALSRRFGALSARIGPRALMGCGPLVAGAGMLLLLRVGADAPYATEVLPGVVVFGLGLTMTVAPLTAAVLAGAEARHAGIASGVNNAVARVAGLLAIAVVGAAVSASYVNALRDRLPHAAPAELAQARTRPFVPVPGAHAASSAASVAAMHTGLAICAGLALAAGAVSLAGIRNTRG